MSPLLPFPTPIGAGRLLDLIHGLFLHRGQGRAEHAAKTFDLQMCKFLVFLFSIDTSSSITAWDFGTLCPKVPFFHVDTFRPFQAGHIKLRPAPKAAPKSLEISGFSGG